MTDRFIYEGGGGGQIFSTAFLNGTERVFMDFFTRLQEMFVLCNAACTLFLFRQSFIGKSLINDNSFDF